MNQSKLFPLALLHIGGSSIEGATRFQKLVFIAQEETNLPDIFEYKADKYGPFSPELAQTLDVLEERNLIEKTVESTRAGNERYDYRLTPKGREVARKMTSDADYEPMFKHAKSIKQKHNNKSLDTILKYVYRKYPNYTKETELDKEELFSNNRTTPRFSR